MNRRDPLLVFALALAVNTVAASFIRTPGYMDAAYYFGGALQLVQGQGFSEPYLWNYLGGQTSLPAVGFLYWMPLTSLVAAAGMAAMGPTFRAAQVPFVLLAALVPVLTYRIGVAITGQRTTGMLAGMLAICSGFYLVFWSNTDAFALYALVAGLTLVAIAHCVAGRGARWFALAGALAGLSHLTRADGVLLLLVAWWAAWRAGRPARSAQRIGAQAFAAAVGLTCAGYLLVMLPWFVRNWLAVGTPLAAGGLQTLWLIEYNDLFRYPPNLTLGRYLSQGWQAILAGKLWAFGQNLQTFVAVQGLVFLAPFIVMGLWRLRQRPLIRPVILYTALLYLAMTFLFTFPGARGGLLHSGVALLPFFFPAGIVGLQQAVAWAANRRVSWNVARATGIFSGAAIAMAAGLTAFIFYTRVIRADWSHVDSLFMEIGASIPPGSVVASNNPPGVFVASGHPGVFIPSDGPEALLAVVRQFRVNYVLLDDNHVPELAPLYRGEISLPGVCPPTEPAAGVLLFAVDSCR